jgi:WD40 repeat protein
MKCLEKDRSRRYETANGLASDITRHLTNEPVVARPPSVTYRFQKAYQRNKVSFVVAALIAVILVVATTFSTWQRKIVISTNQQLTNTVSELRLATELGAKQRRIVESTNQQLTNTVSELRSQIVRNYSGRAREAKMNQSPSQALYWISQAVKNSPETSLNAALNLDLTSSLPAYRLGKVLEHEGKVRGAQFNENETRVLSWGDDKTIRLWDAESGGQIGDSMLHQGLINGAQFNRDGTRILSWSHDKTVRLWDTENSDQIGDPMLHQGVVLGAQFNMDETRILSWGVDSAIRLWDVDNGQ